MSVYVTILRLSMLGVLTLPLQCEHYLDCEFNLTVHRNTFYEASVGQELRIACPVHFCNGTTPTVTWFKQGMSVNLSDRVTTEWTTTNDHEGISFLNFHDVLSRDSGRYHCRSEEHVSHNIHVSVVCRSDVPYHSTVHTATAGGPLNISCSETVCDNRPPSVTWFKYGTEGLVHVNMSTRVTTEWTRVSNYEAKSFLIFHKVLSGDSGRYLCNRSSANHTIDVHVIDPPHFSGWSFLYRSVGLIVFFIIIVSVYIVLNKRKNYAVSSAGKDSYVTSSGEPRHNSFTVQNEIYENVL